MDSHSYDERIYSLEFQINKLRQHHWFQHELWAWQWWLLLFITFVPWILWWGLTRKKITKNALIYGLIVMLISLLLDNIGSHLNLWAYQYNLTPFEHQLGPINLAVLPVTFMLVFQFSKSFMSFFINNLLIATGGAFIIEPIFEKIHIYKAYHWHHIYSFPIYIIMPLIIRGIIEYLIFSENKKRLGHK